MARRLLLALTLALAACKTTRGAAEVDLEEPAGVGDLAAAELKKGDESLENADYTEAQRHFEAVKAQFPFSEAALVAELRLGDVQLASDQFAEARDRYDTFIKAHPTSSQVDYAAFKSALTYWKEAPTSVFFMPPAYQKDLTPVHSAVQAFRQFLRDYPKSKHVPEAEQVLKEALTRLAEHEWCVAEFYAKRKHWDAVVMRLKELLKSYPNIGFDERALFMLHDASVQLKDPQGAQDALKQIITRFPGTPAAERATRMLGS
jgi:outer membrane protein assembly factor BamD